MEVAGGGSSSSSGGTVQGGMIEEMERREGRIRQQGHQDKTGMMGSNREGRKEWKRDTEGRLDDPPPACHHEHVTRT